MKVPNIKLFIAEANTPKNPSQVSTSAAPQLEEEPGHLLMNFPFSGNTLDPWMACFSPPAPEVLLLCFKFTNEQ